MSAAGGWTLADACFFGPVGCAGRPTNHHLISQQRIKRRWETLNAAYRRGMGPRPWSKRRCLEDRRNILRVCWDGHHQRVENRLSIAVEAHELPEGFWDFVDEYGLHAEVPREWPGPRDGGDRAAV